MSCIAEVQRNGRAIADISANMLIGYTRVSRRQGGGGIVLSCSTLSTISAKEMFWSGDLDRLSRFLRDVLRVMERIQRVKTVFRSFTGGDRYGHLGRPIDEADDWIVHRV
jgi:hypothetical protein